MAVPGAPLRAVQPRRPEGALRGWAIPSATDIAFALAVLAVISTHLPSALRTFLLTLAVVDDLLAIVVIAIFYTEELSLGFLALSLVPLAVFGVLVQRRVRSAWLLLPLAALAWVLMHESGVHATVAGVLLAFTVPVVRSDAAGGPDAGPGLAEHFEHRIRPLSAGVAVPVFAFFSAGVAVGGLSGLGASLGDSVAIGIVVGLVAGKAIGITAATWLVSRFTRAQLDEDLGWPDVARAVAARRDRLHRLAAHHRARLRGRERALRPRQGRHPRRHVARGRPGRRAPAAAQPPVPADRRRRRRATPTPTASPTSGIRSTTGARPPFADG